MNKGMFLGGTLFKAERLLFSKESPLNFKNEKEDHLYLKKAKEVKKIRDQTRFQYAYKIFLLRDFDSYSK